MNHRYVAFALFGVPTLMLGTLAIIFVETFDLAFTLSVFKPFSKLFLCMLGGLIATVLGIYIWRRGETFSQARKWQICLAIFLICALTFGLLAMLPALTALVYCLIWMRSKSKIIQI
jgi:hypothetical protein